MASPTPLFKAGVVQESRSEPGLRAVTLITGDRFLVDRDGDLVSVTPGEGREEVGFRVEASRDHLYAIPTDAERMIAQGTLDRGLFDLKALLDAGYDDARRGELPLILGGTTSTSLSATRLGSRPVPEGTVVTKKLPAVRGVAVEVGKETAGELWKALTLPNASRAAAGIRKIWLDGTVRATLDRSVPQIGAPSAWAAGYTGQGVRTAVLDTGIDSSHPDLAGRVVGERNFSGAADAVDHFGHGTHVASIITGSGAASDGKFKGVAPGVTLLNGKVLGDQGSGSESGILAGMQWAVDQGAKVVNMSLGGPDGPGTDPLEDAVDTLSARYGTLFVVAAGNEGDDGDSTVGSPGSADAALTVGAVDDSDALASFSSTGPRVDDNAVKPDITGPGVHIVAARAAGTALCQNSCVQPGDGPVDDHYTSASGTSMATPHVAGAAALLASAHPDWSGGQLKRALMASARPTADRGAFQQGAGRVDVAAAMNERVTSDPASLSFGLAAYPHTDDAPAGKTLTYRNSGDEDVVLDLAASTTDRAGRAVNDGTFTVSPERVTVPAGGTATATVTSDTRVGSTLGQLSGTVTATTASATAAAAAVVARTPLGIVRETERYDLTLRHIGADGNAPAPATGDTLYDVVTGEIHSISMKSDGTAVVRVPPGTYHLTSTVYTRRTDGSYARAALYQPEIVVDRDTSLTLDARVAKPISVTLPDPQATASSGVLAVRRTMANGQGRLTSSWLGSLDRLSFAQIGGPSTTGAKKGSTTGTATGSLQAMIGGVWTRPEAYEGANPPEYRLAYSLPEKPYAGLTRHLTRRDLARIDSTLGASVTKKRADISAVPYAADGMSSAGVAIRTTTALPRVQTDYVNTEAAVSWGFIVTQNGQTLQNEANYYTPERRYRPGRTYRATYGVGVFGPGLGLAEGRDSFGGTGWGLFRTGDTLRMSIPLHTDGAGHPGTTGLRFGGSARTTLVADGTSLLNIAAPPSTGDITVPAGDARYTLSTDLNQQATITDVSSRITSTWTFRSATVPTGTQRVPLLNVRYAPRLATDSTTPAGKPVLVPVTVEGARAGVRTLTVDVSYDAGRSWQRAPVHAGRALLLRPPTDSASVSLRAKAVDGRGNTAEQTIIRAFKVTPLDN
ncbi:S8 family serine peptidase [Streptomyces sp. NBC_01485]|uniref:S8 family serine peptidase n=1 Tax=Streptomyces sp. NBC_01485 TaxID=2903884 RepID=UPI002E37B3EB|nr:S8 family serine peptidase [Streptomyces sp. NBC_01485]